MERLAAALCHRLIQRARRRRPDGRHSLRQCQTNPQATASLSTSGEPSHKAHTHSSDQDTNSGASEEATSYQTLSVEAASHGTSLRSAASDGLAVERP